MTDEPKKKRRVSQRGCKAKGSIYEREVAAYLNEQVSGLSVRRALLSGGGRSDGGMDLDGFPHIWPELKRVEKLNFHDAMKQATGGVMRSGRTDLKPAVIQSRTFPMRPNERPNVVPKWLTDIKDDNWGLLNGKPVCHDYGLLHGIGVGGLVKARWS